MSFLKSIVGSMMRFGSCHWNPTRKFVVVVATVLTAIAAWFAVPKRAGEELSYYTVGEITARDGKVQERMDLCICNRNDEPSSRVWLEVRPGNLRIDCDRGCKVARQDKEKVQIEIELVPASSSIHVLLETEPGRVVDQPIVVTKLNSAYGDIAVEQEKCRTDLPLSVVREILVALEKGRVDLMPSVDLAGQ